MSLLVNSEINIFVTRTDISFGGGGINYIVDYNANKLRPTSVNCKHRTGDDFNIS
jgi:hypothetical protein